MNDIRQLAASACVATAVVVLIDPPLWKLLVAGFLCGIAVALWEIDE